MSRPSDITPSLQDRAVAADVSIVMCTYNGERFLREQLDSLLQQTYPIREIIVQDDGSTDGTARIVAQYAAKHPNISFYSNEGPHGINSNFFSAMRHATSPFIAIADQDDIWEPRKTEWQMAAIGSNLLVGGMSQPFSNDPQTPVDYDGRQPNTSLLRMLYVGMMPGHTLLFRRELLDMLPQCSFFMYDLQLQATAAAAESVVHLHRVLVHQRRHQSAATYAEPLSRRHSIGNMMRAAWGSLSIYRELRPHIRRRFSEWQAFLQQLPFSTESKRQALIMSQWQAKRGPWAYLMLTATCLRNRRWLNHTVEPNSLLTTLRALYFPIYCTTYYRYLCKNAKRKGVKP